MLTRGDGDGSALNKHPSVGANHGENPAEESLAAGVAPAALRLYESRDALLEALRAKQVVAVVLPVSELALAGRAFPGLQAGATVGTPGHVAWAVRKGDDALRRALDEHIANVRRGPTWSRLIVKYFGDQTLAVLGRER
jgi:ABC-type amino acid transport substrate-binding protein